MLDSRAYSISLDLRAAEWRGRRMNNTENASVTERVTERGGVPARACNTETGTSAGDRGNTIVHVTQVQVHSLRTLVC